MSAWVYPNRARLSASRADTLLSVHPHPLSGLSGDFEAEVLRLRYSSLTTPPSIYDQHLPTGVDGLRVGDR